MVLAQDLRDAVLQAALQGKLTEQLETDSSVDELLDKIRKKKIEIMRKRNLKSEPILNEYSSDSYPFQIPQNWKWCQLGEIIVYQNGYAYKSIELSTIKKGLPVIKSQNIMTLKTVISDNNDYVESPTQKMLDSQIRKNDLLMCLSSQSSNPEPLGKTAIYEFDTPALLNQRVLKMTLIDSEMLKYIFYVINSHYFHYTVSHRGDGSAQSNLKLEHVREMLIPIPPIEEQQRIVNRVNELMKKIDDYEKVEKELLALEQRFPDDMKNALLQAAMQGKLTEQLDSDSSVDELIDKCCNDKKQAIEEGKYRKERYRGAIEYSKDLPCKIPENWRWVYISDMSLFQEGPGILAKDFRNSGVPLIRISGMKSDKVSLEGCNYLDENMVKNKWNHFKLDLGDIVISTSASMDKIAEVQEDTVNAILYTGLIRFKMYGNINKEFFKYFIKSPFYLHQIDEQKAGGTIKHYGPSHLKKMVIPLPPIEEQQRIVERLEQLLPFCETL